MSPEPRPSKGGCWGWGCGRSSSDPPGASQHLCFADFHSKEKAEFFLAFFRRRCRLSASRRGESVPEIKRPGSR